MRWQRKVVSATNITRRATLGEHIRVAENGLTAIVGLLGERELVAGDGLLIVPSQGVHTWGMRFAIDVVVLDDAWRVIAIRREMRPFRVTPVFWKAAAVLELQSGTVDSSGTQVNDMIEFSRVNESVH
jgi:uncharacterized protein